MEDKEKVLEDFEYAIRKSHGEGWDYVDGLTTADGFKILALLKEQDVVVKQWKKEIADNQLAHAPKNSREFMSLDEHLENEYKRGIWNGLQMAWDILTEGESMKGMDIREIVGLWCDDITFCQEQCGWRSCPRNKKNIRDRTIPHSFSVEIPEDCPKQKEGR